MMPWRVRRVSETATGRADDRRGLTCAVGGRANLRSSGGADSVSSSWSSSL